MKGKITTTQLAIIFSLSIIIGCGTSEEFNSQNYYNHLQETFKIGAEEFFKGNYEDAKNLFINYNKTDTGYINYQSYAFLAECYNKLGMQDSGKIIYENVIRKLNNKHTEWYHDLDKIFKRWYSDYPHFPDNLRKENGFVPYDTMPQPIGGIEAIESKVIYPEQAKRAGIEGRVYIKAYIDEFGDVVKTEVVKGIGEGCDEAAANAVQKTKFKPGTQKGHRVKALVTIPIVFHLEDN